MTLTYQEQMSRGMPRGTFDSMSDAPTAAAYGVGPAWIGGRQYWSDGSNWLASSEARVYASMSVAPTAAAYGVGPAWIGGNLYWSNASIWSISSPPKLARPRIILVGDSITASGFTVTGNAYSGTATSDGTTVTIDTGNAAFATGAVGNWFQLSKGSQPVDTPLLGAMRKVLSSSGTNVTFSAICGDEVFPAGSSASWVLAGTNVQSCGWFGWFNFLAGNPFVVSGQYAMGGFGTDYLPYILPRITNGPDYDVMAVCIGHNDMAVGLTAAATFANTLTFIEDFLARGKAVIWVTPPAWSSGSTSYTTAKAVENAKLCSMIREYCRLHPEIVLFDLHRITVDGTSTAGNFKSGYSTDGIHPTGDAFYPAYRDSTQVADVISQLGLRKWDLPFCSALDTGATAGTDNLVTNGHMEGSSGLPTGWAEIIAPTTGSVTYTPQIARSDLAGYNLNAALSSATGGIAFYSAVTSRLASVIGRWFEFGCEVAFTSSAPANINALDIRIFLNGGGWGGMTWSAFANGAGVVAASNAPFTTSDKPIQVISQPVFIRGDVAAPTSSLLILGAGFSAASTGTIQFSRAFMRETQSPFE